MPPISLKHPAQRRILDPGSLLLVGDSERNADLLYAVRMFIPDPFVFLRINGRPYVALDDPELERARRLAAHCRVLSLSRYAARLQRQGVRPNALAEVIREILRDQGAKKVLVPPAFPFGLARELRRLKIKVRVKPGPVFPERQFKSMDEVKKISAALTMAEVGLAEGIQVLKNSKIGRNRRLLFRNVPLTAEKLRGVIDTAILQAGGCASRTVVAGGKQAADPRESGHGLLRANEPIVLDVFPRSQKTGYYGDITRTVVRGRATEPVRRLYHAVACAQALAFSKLESGAAASDIHNAVRDFFHREGFRTGKRHGRMEGFCHSTGHGLGLERHEAPRLSAASTDTLRPGHVVTLEPGLYYPSLGAVRLEDVAHVTSNSPRNLTKFEKVLEV